MTMFSSQWFASPGVAAGYEVDYSCRFNDDDSATLSKTYAGAGTSDKISQIEFWFKRGLLATERYIFSVESNSFQIAFDANDKLNIFYFTSSYLFRLHTTQVFRDPHAWYHLTLHLDTTPSTPSASSMGLLINGVAVTAFDTATYPSQNQAMGLGTATNFNIGSNNSPASYYDGYISHFLYCDGNSSSTPYSAEFDSNGVWRPKDASSATFGDNGFWLDFAVAPDTGDGAGTDVSGKNNHFTDTASLTAADRVIDTPTNNYCTLSPIGLSPAGASFGLGDGNLYALPVTTAWNLYYGSQMVRSGKWIFEATWTGTLASHAFIGFLRDDHPYTANDARTTTPDAKSHVWTDNQERYDLDSSSTSQGATWTGGDVITCELDYSAQTIKWYKNGGSVETTSSSISNTHGYIPCVGLYGDSSRTVTVNFGQYSFTATPTTDHVAINTTNLAVPAITDGADEFVMVADTESNIEATLATARTGWSSYVDILKNRDSAEAWIWRWSSDSSNETLLENANLTYQSKASVSGSDNWIGMSIKVDGTVGKCRAGSQAHVRGAGDTTVSFTSVGTTDYAVFTLDRGADEKAVLHHPHTAAGYNLTFNTAYAQGNSQGYMSVQNKTATSFDIDSLEVTGTYDWLVLPQSDLISLDGYTPNTNADGPVVLMPQSPKAVIVRANNGTSNTHLIDVVTQKYNVHGTTLKMNSNAAEAGTTDFDLLGNGLKLRKNDDTNEETSCVTIAFADNPFGGHGGRFGGGAAPATAR